MTRSRGLQTLIHLASFALLSAGCTTGALGSFFSIGSLFSLVPGPQGPAGTDGTNGQQGPTGADGQLRIYGDGSAGSVTVSDPGLNDLTDADVAPELNLQFVNFTVDAQSNLRVPSGTIIRCTGTFTVNGMITVITGEESDGVGTLPGAGVSHAPAGNCVISDATPFNLNGSTGGDGLTNSEATLLLSITPSGGGAGGGFFDPIGSTLPGGDGGGAFLVLAQGGIAISPAAQIIADGDPGNFSGTAGGAGGIVILASPASISFEGHISAHGGNGIDADTQDNVAGGGGGGGGIVHLLAPSIVATGTVDVAGGSGGVGAFGSIGTRAGGAGGGACGGSGGKGGDVFPSPANDLRSGVNGSLGYFIQSAVNPTSLF